MKNERLGNGKNISVFLIIEGFAHIIISLVSEQNSVIFGLSMQQILSFCVMSLGFCSCRKDKIAMYGGIRTWLFYYIY